MNTAMQQAIAEFERLKSKAESLKDMVYLDGVLAVLDGFLEIEKEQIGIAFENGRHLMMSPIEYYNQSFNPSKS